MVRRPAPGTGASRKTAGRGTPRATPNAAVRLLRSVPPGCGQAGHSACLSAQVDGDSAREHRVVQFGLDGFGPSRHIESQLTLDAVARVDVVEKDAVRSVGAVDVDIGVRAGVVLPAAGVVDVLR